MDVWSVPMCNVNTFISLCVFFGGVYVWLQGIVLLYVPVPIGPMSKGIHLYFFVCECVCVCACVFVCVYVSSLVLLLATAAVVFVPPHVIVAIFNY